MWARYEKPNNTCPIAKLVLTFDRLEFVAHGGELLVSSPEDVVWGLGQLPLVQSQMALIDNIKAGPLASMMQQQLSTLCLEQY